MSTITVQCDCGQSFEFDVESLTPLVDPIACPSCGADGTDRANAAIAQQAAPKPTAAPGLRVATHSASAPARVQRTVPGQLSHEQAMHEARAKILWGDSPESVASFLRVHGFSREEAAEFVDDLYRERLSTVRGSGFANIIGGSLLIAIPIVFFAVSWFIVGRLYTRLFALTVVVGFVGLWMLIKGLHMVVSPKSQSGHSEEPD